MRNAFKNTVKIKNTVKNRSNLFCFVLLLCFFVNYSYSSSAEELTASYYYNKAMLETNVEKKIELLRNSCETDKKKFIAFYELGKVLISKNDKEGLKYLYLALLSTSTRINYNVYKVLLKYYYFDLTTRDYKNANKCLQKLIKFEDSYLYYLMLGEVNGISGIRDYKTSIKFYKKALEKKKEKTTIFYNIAENFYYLNDFLNTIKWFEKYPDKINHKHAFLLMIDAYFQLWKVGNKKYYLKTKKYVVQYLAIWKNDKKAQHIYNTLIKKKS